MHAVVLRAAGDRAFCAGLDTKKPYGQPDDVWNHEDPGELLSPKWQQVWKPVVCAVHGHLHRRRVLLRQRGRHRHLLGRRDVLRLARDLRAGVRARTGRAHAQDRPRRDAAHRAVGQRRARHRRRPRCASASSPRSCARDELWARAHEIAAGIARKPTAATQGTVRAIWESLDRPYRAAMQQGLIYTRLGNPIGMAEVAEQGPDRPDPRLR